VDIGKHLIVKPGEKARLGKRDPGETLGIRKNENLLQKNLAKLRELQHLLYADKRYSLLIVLQALDAGGKDGTIRHVMSGVNPQGCEVTSFKAPSQEERDHDFLWRIHHAVPRLGDIGIFNRSHYEDVLVVRVHKMVPKAVWSERYEQINDFEKTLALNGVTILKFFLHISKDEQLKRFQSRLSDPAKNWKLSLPDFREREHWDEYMEAYEDALTRCSTKHAPWYIIPSNQKWFRNYAISCLVIGALERMKLKFPPPSIDVSKIKLS
jgi:PPK2 family polyphosphate:nucleotide phosphotransferase